MKYKMVVLPVKSTRGKHRLIDFASTNSRNDLTHYIDLSAHCISVIFDSEAGVKSEHAR